MRFIWLIYYLIFFVLINSGCQKKEELLVINPQSFSNDKFTLSMIADDITYIPLDNHIPIGLFHSMKINTKGIFISTKDPGLIHFDVYGKFIKVLAKRGRGPGEYLFGNTFAVDEENELIFLVDYGSINVYNLNGNFIRSFSTRDFIDGMADHIELFNSSLFLSDYGTFGNFNFNWVIIDTTGVILSTKKSTVTPNGFMLRGSTYKFECNMYYYNCLNDTIFSVLPDLESQPAYLFAIGDFRWPNNVNMKTETWERIKSYFKPGVMFETKHFIFLKYSYREKEAILMIDKQSKVIYQGYIDNFGACIQNDLDNGLHFILLPHKFNYYINSRIEYVASVIYPFELKEHISSVAFKNSTSKYPEKKKELEQLANSLDENDNPVLMLVKLKE